MKGVTGGPFSDQSYDSAEKSGFSYNRHSTRARTHTHGSVIKIPTLGNWGVFVMAELACIDNFPFNNRGKKDGKTWQNSQLSCLATETVAVSQALAYNIIP